MTGTIFLEASELSIGEANGTVFVPIARTGDLSGTAAIEYGITPNTATDGADYIGGSGTVAMEAGQARVVVPVQIMNESASEPTETFTFSIINVDSGSTLLFPRTARIDILDDENPAVDPPDVPLNSSYNVTQQAVITGLSEPMAFEFAPQDSSLVFVAEKGGRIRVFDLDTDNFLPDFINLAPKVNSIYDRGLMDIALHPNFPQQPYVYAFYVVDPTDTAGRTGNAGPDGGGNRFAHVVRLTADAATGFTTVVPGSEVILVGGSGQSLQHISGAGSVDSTDNFNQPESGFNAQTGAYVDDYIKVDSRSHAGGSLAFGRDGALYVSIGDGTSFNATDPRTVSVQNLDSLSGKILRIDSITGLGLPDNPFVQSGDSLDTNRSKVYQLGLRNPFSMAFDQDGRLFITNTGWNSYEEIESGPPGANFGWPYYEGGDNGVLLRTGGYQALPSSAGFYAAVENGGITITPAFRAFAHASSEPGFQNQAITGGDVVYRGSRYPAEFQNDFFFTDIVDGEVFVVDVNDRRDLEFLYRPDGGPVHFSHGPDGYVYYADLFTGVVGRLLIEPKQAETLLTRGSATYDFASDVYTLTSSGNQAGMVMSATRIDLRQNFTISFQAYLGTADGGADGLAFVLHNDPAGVNAIGAAGSGLAIGGIRNGLAIEFDTFANLPGWLVSGPLDIVSDHTGFLDTDGSFGTTPFALGNIEDGQWHNVSVAWNAATQRLSYTFDGVSVGTLSANIASEYLGGSDFAHFGVGAGTGALSNEQRVRFTSIDFTPPPSTVPLAPRGSATYDFASDVYTLTSSGNQAGMVMSATRIDLRQNFTISFQAYLGTADGGADGLAFVLHNDPAGVNAIGAAGSGLAIGGIRNGLAIEFDTFANLPGWLVSGPLDIVSDHTGFLDTDGSFGTTPFALGNIEDGQWHNVSVAWNAATQRLSYTFDGVSVGTLSANIASEYLGGSDFAHFGVGAGTGALSNEQRVRFTSIDFTPPPSTVPLAPRGSATYDFASDVYTLTSSGNQAGMVMSATRIDLRQNFTISFQAYLGTADGGADGLAFVLHNDPAGVNAIGAAGSGLAIGGIRNGLAIEFDTFANLPGWLVSGPLDIVSDHTGFLDTDGSFGTTPFALGNIEDGQWHNVSVAWNAATQRLSYTFDGVSVGTLSANIASEYLGGSDFAHFGVGAGTGALSNEQRVRFTSIDFTPPPSTVPLAPRGSATYDFASDVYTLTSSGNQAGMVMSATRIDLRQNFTISFQAYLGTADGGADGLAFVLHNDPAGVNAIGAAGSGLAIGGIRNGLAIEFDTFANLPGWLVSGPLDIVSDHTGFLDTDGSFGTTPFALGNIEDGQWHNVSVAWNAATQRLSYTFDGVSVGTLSANIASEYLGGSDFAHFGVGAGTGALSNEQRVRFTSIEGTFEGQTPDEGTVANIESVTGGSGNDTLVGDALANSVSGGNGNDRITGASGNDALDGRSGNDTFVFAPGFGNDIITDFDYNPSGGQDLLDISAFGTTAATFESRVTVADLGANISVTIDGDPTQVITLLKAQQVSNISQTDLLLFS